MSAGDGYKRPRKRKFQDTAAVVEGEASSGDSSTPDDPSADHDRTGQDDRVGEGLAGSDSGNRVRNSPLSAPQPISTPLNTTSGLVGSNAPSESSGESVSPNSTAGVDCNPPTVTDSTMGPGQPRFGRSYLPYPPTREPSFGQSTFGQVSHPRTVPLKSAANPPLAFISTGAYVPMSMYNQSRPYGSSNVQVGPPSGTSTQPERGRDVQGQTHEATDSDSSRSSRASLSRRHIVNATASGSREGFVPPGVIPRPRHDPRGKARD
jgi:hypothetical protein